LNNIKIIGLPVVVSARSRIVLDTNIRSLYGIACDDTVIMHMEQGFLFISPASSTATGERKHISIGRFNLPQEWVKQNNIQLGDFVYLIATDNGIVVCPKNLELICVGRPEK
jgi:hypothetical protein